MRRVTAPRRGRGAGIERELRHHCHWLRAKRAALNVAKTVDFHANGGFTDAMAATVLTDLEEIAERLSCKPISAKFREKFVEIAEAARLN